MKSTFSIFVFSITILCGFTFEIKAQTMWQVSSEKVVRWYYNDGDEFSAHSLNTEKWLTGYPYGRTLYCNYEQEFYTDGKNIDFSNGILRLTAKHENITEKVLHWEADDNILKCGDKELGPNKRTFSYTSGMIYSVKKYHYGYYEIKFRSDQGRGLWPAFWLYAGHENDEIDIFEIKGERNSELHVDVHCQNGCNNYKSTLGLVKRNWGDYLRMSSAWHEGFNVVGMEWNQNYIKWYLNGQGIAYWKGKMEFPATVIANLAIPSDNGPFGPGPDASTQFPATFEIDYIRIWSSQQINQSEVLFEPHLSGTMRASFPVSNSQLVKRKRPEYKKSELKGEIVNVTFSKIDMDGFMVTLTGTPQSDFEIEVKDKNQEVIYKSNDLKLREHHFYIKNTDGSAYLKMRVNGKIIEHRF